MKKLFLLIMVVIFSLIIIACGDSANGTGGNNGNSENSTVYKIGDKGSGGGTVFFAESGQYKECSGELGSYDWFTAMTTASSYKGNNFTNWRLPDSGELELMYDNLHKKKLGGFSNEFYWSSTRSGGYYMYLDFYNGSLSYYYGESVYRVRAVRSFTGGTGDGTSGTTLRINNQSFTEITEVIWQNVTFANNEFENSIKSGTYVINNVEPGGGYIFFKRKTNPIIARTRDLIIIEANEQEVFPFTDNTIIVEINNPNNTGTLGQLSSTVVWFDDAEGDYLPYQQRKNSSYVTFSRYGKKGINISYNGELSFNIILAKNAKLSFWHNALLSSSSNGGINFLKVNNEIIKEWSTSNEWSFFEHQLDSGNTTIQFITGSSDNIWLDDLLIYYTE